MALLEVTNLHKNFDQLQVLKGVSFSLDRGQTLSVIGPSGGGKTTLLRCLNFLEMPSDGKIVINGGDGPQVLFDRSQGRELTASQIRQNRLHFGLVFQNFNLFPQYTARQNVSLAPALQAKATEEYRRNKKAVLETIEARSVDLLRRVGLGDKLDYYPHQLSGGQQQRVAIARALAKNPKLLLCDEPTGALDYVTGKAILKLLQDTCRQQGMTVIVITHNTAIAPMADKVIHVKNGQVEQIDLNPNPLPVEEIEW